MTTNDQRSLTIATMTLISSMPNQYSEEDRQAAALAVLSGEQWDGVPKDFPDPPQKFIAWAGRSQMKVYRHMHGYRAVGGKFYEVCVMAEKGGYHGHEQFTAEEIGTLPSTHLWSCSTSPEQQGRMWNNYFGAVAATGDDYADQLVVPEAQYTVTTWRVTLEEREGGLCVIEGGRYHPTNLLKEHLAPREFPIEVRAYLMMAADHTDNYLRAGKIRTLQALTNIPGTTYLPLQGALGQLAFSVPERFHTPKEIQEATQREALAALDRLTQGWRP